MANKPKIRFKGFDDAWEQRKLGELGSLKNGMNFSKKAMGIGFPFVNLQNIFGNNVIDVSNLGKAMASDSQLKDYNLLNGDVLFVRSSVKLEGVGEAALVPQTLDNTTYSGFIIRFRDEYGLDNNFKRFVFGIESVRNQIMSQATNSANKNISQSVLENLELAIPSKSEQQKIGAYFSNLDHLITLHQRKYLQKKKTSLTWEQRKLGDVVERVTRKNQDLVSQLPLTISAQYGLIDQNMFFDKRVASKDVSGYYLIYNGEFAYNKSTSSDAPWGAIKRLDRYENGVLSTLYIVFKIKNEKVINSDFLVTYYDTCNWHKDIKAVAAEGARNHGLLNIAPADFFKTELMLPQDIEEQKKIGSYFKLIDHLITLHQRKCDQMKELKKYMLTKMFPQNGAKVPEIRFDGFIDDWEQRKLGDVAEFSKGSGYSKGDLVEYGTPIILYGRLYTNYETRISDVDTFVEAKVGSVYSKGGEVIVPASGETAEDIARAATVDKSGILLGGDLNIVMPNKDINSSFLAISISSGNPQRELAKKAQGKSVVHIHNEEIKNLVLPFPIKDEQNKIASYFCQLDNLITLHQHKCNELREIKKYMLKNMFI